jgi:hypothetical protein
VGYGTLRWKKGTHKYQVTDIRVFPMGETETLDFESDALVVHGFRPDYGSGPHMLLLADVVSLARRDMSNPLYSAECRSFLTGDLVALFADCLGFEGSFLDARSG